MVERTTGPRRGPILVVVAAVLVLAGLVDQVGARSTSGAADLAAPVPVAAPAAALSSSWFCAGATDGAPGTPKAEGTVVVANSGARPVSAHVTIVSTSGSTRTAEVGVPAHGQGSVAETLRGGAPWVGAIVEVDGGAVAVSQQIDGQAGVSFTPCATSGSGTWFFPSGSTLINSDTVISLLNPYPADSIVDLSFTTDQGVESPVDFEGLDVPPRSIISVDLRGHLRRRTSIATTVSARTGSVVAWQTAWTDQPAKGSVIMGTPAAQSPLADPASPDAGITVTLGAPSAGSTWVWADGVAGNGVDERYTVYNPGSASAEVRLSLHLAQGNAEPFDLSVPGFDTVQVVSAEEARIPAGVAHSATLSSLNGVPVVAERTIASASGLGGMLGMRMAARQWLVPVTAKGRSEASFLIFYNPQAVAETVTIDSLQGGGAIPLGLARGYRVGPSARLAVAIAPLTTNGNPLVVSATAAVYAEYDAYGPPGGGTSLSPAVPLAG